MMSLKPLLRARRSIPSALTTISNLRNMSSEKIIIMFKDGVSKEQIDKYISEINGGGGEVVHNYGDLLPGFAANVTPSQLQLFQSLQDDVIASIERDGVVTTQ